MAHAASLTIDGAELRVASLAGRVAVSETFAFDLVTEVAADVADASKLVGADAALTLRDGFGGEVVLHGLATRVARRPWTGQDELGDRGAALEIRFEPSLRRLWIGRDSRVFQEVSVVDLVKDVLDRGSIPSGEVRWAIGGEPPVHPYRAQTRESDGELVARLLAEEGIWFAFEPGDDATTVAFSDDSTSAADLEGGATVDVLDGGGLQATRPSLRAVVRRASLTASGVTLRDYDPKRPQLELEGKAGEGPYERYDVPGRFVEPADGERLARIRLEAERARRVVITGRSTTLRVWPGRIVEVAGHERPSVDGRWFVTAVGYRMVDARGDGTAHELRIDFEAIPADVPFRAPLLEAPRRPGPQTGVVVGPSGSEIHPDDMVRVRVQHFWDRVGAKDDTASTWMRVGQLPLSGSMLVPRVGWEVLVAHHEDDADQPTVVAHLYDGVLKPPYPLPANKTRSAWQTATTPGGGTSNELRFEDAAGAEELFLNASHDMNVVIAHDKGEKVGVDYTHEIGADHTVTVGTARDHGVITTQDQTVGGSETITVSGARETVVTGSETTSIGGSRTVIATGGSQHAAEGGRTLTVGGSAIGVAVTEISRTSLGTASVSIAGSLIQLAGAGVEDAVGGACAETVGGAKIAIAGGGYDLAAKGALAENVGGAYIAAAGGNAGETSKGKLTFNVGGAFIGNAPAIEIEAKSQIKIQVGGASLTIKSGKIHVKAPTIGLPAAGVAKSGADVKHN